MARCVSNHQPHDCLLNRLFKYRSKKTSLFKYRSKKTSTLCVSGLCAGNSPVTGEFPTQRASNAENVSIWWRHNGSCYFSLTQEQIAGNKCQIGHTLSAQSSHYINQYWSSLLTHVCVTQRQWFKSVRPNGKIAMAIVLLHWYAKFAHATAFIATGYVEGFQNDMVTSSNGNIFRVTGHLCGEFTGQRWIPSTRASDAELRYFLWSAPE